MLNTVRLLSVIGFLTVFCLGCDKSGSSHAVSIPSEVTREDDSSLTPPIVDTTPTTSDPCGQMNVAACQTFELVNQQRVAQSLAPLKVLSQCVLEAQSHAEDMFTNHFFSHDSPTETWVERYNRFGITGGYRGENIAQASAPTQAVQMWMNSSGHRANILNSKYISTGIGQVGNIYVQCFSSYSGDL